MKSNIWIDSNGGPLVLIPVQLLSKWKGIDGDDYERACAVNDEIGIIPLGDGSALVLGSPDPTTGIETSEGVSLLRWVCADSEEQMFESLTAAKDVVAVEEFEFTSEHEEYVLFDSAFPGDEALDRLEFRLEKARYKILTKEVMLPRTGFILHTFTATQPNQTVQRIPP